MEEKTFTYTAKQIKAIFDAGRRHGAEAECSFQSGTGIVGWHYNDLIDVIYDIENEQCWPGDNQTSWNTVEKWFKENK